MTPPTDLPCPCGSGATLPRCCGRYIGGAAAPTAEALMRSRYTAFVLGDDGYLRESWHPATCPASIASADGPEWVRLEVMEVEGGGAGESEGWVTFAAHYRDHGRAGVLRERSRFVREAGRWRYVEGGVQPAPGRNAPCPCGSGRKFKRCCGR